MLIKKIIATSAFFGSVVFAATVFGQGALTPPGSPAPTMKSLAQIEPRTPISSVPVTLSSAGSYYLTTNLAVTSDVTGITINGNNITLDLNGFNLRGFNGNADGILVQGGTNVTIRNGTITGWGGNGHGIIAQGNMPGLLVEGINASGNNTGIYISSTGFIVRDCRCFGNRYDGIYSSGIGGTPAGTITGCTVTGNNNAGIECYDGTVKDCQIISNNSVGLSTASCQVSGCRIENCGTNSSGYGINCQYCDIRSCLVQNCPGYGIYDYNGSRIADCSILYCGNIEIYTGGNSQINDCRVIGGSNHGIQASAQSIVHNCQIANNGGYGVYAYSCTVTGCTIDFNRLSGIYVNAPGCLISGNHLQGDNSSNNSSFNAGIYLDDANNRVEDNHVIGSGVAGISINTFYSGNVVVKNYVQGNGANNYLGTANNDFGPIGSAATATSPWANISH